MSIGSKLIAVMDACQYISKDGRNDFQRYDYTTAAGLFAKVNAELVKQGLFTQSEVTLLESRDVTTAKGNSEKYAVVQAKITVTDFESGEHVTFSAPGSGQDVGDKAVMKAVTAATKYAYVTGLCIAMGDDPEQDSTTNAYNSYSAPVKNSAPAEPKTNGNGNYVAKCSACGKGINQKTLDYSKNKFGKPLCYDCQQKFKNSDASAEPF